MKIFYQVPTTWKGAIGTGMLLTVIVSLSMQAQSWLDGRERESAAAACEQRVINVRNYFKDRSDERDGVVKEVKSLADDTRNNVKEVLELLKKRVPVTDKIAQKVDSIDNKATTAISQSKSAQMEATKAARAAEANQVVPPQSAGAINDKVRSVNRGSK